MIKRLNAIVIKTTDYKESDRIITLFSAEEGKTSAVMRGVKKKDAKMKFAGQLFNYGEYEIIMPSGTVSGCNQKDSFFSLTSDYEAFLAACVVAEVLSGDFTGDETAQVLFTEALKALTALRIGAAPSAVIALFLHRGTQILGFGSDSVSYLLTDNKLCRIYGGFSSRIENAVSILEKDGYSADFKDKDELQILLELFALFYEQNITGLKTLDEFNALMNS